MSLPKLLTERDEGLSYWCILSGYRGSIAHGLYVRPDEPFGTDDKDVMAICAPPQSYYLGLDQYGSRGTKEIKYDEWDVVIYEVQKFISLLLKGNPNVLMLLWLSPCHYIKRTEAGDLLIENRGIFVGRHVYRAFTGYAHSQLHRMTHYKLGGYMGQKRKKLVERFGYDTKNAAHLMRLLRMGIEFLKDGELYVERHDRQELLEIKRGEWPLERIQSEADRLFTVAQEAYLNSSLPIGPDREAASHLCAMVIRTAWEGRNLDKSLRKEKNG